MISSDLFIIDTETTGLGKYPYDLILEIAISKIDKNLDIQNLYSSFISWENSRSDQINKCWWAVQANINYSEIQITGKLISKVWNEITPILNGKRVTSWNVAYDFDKFLIPMAKDLGNIPFEIMECPMLRMTDICKIPHYYGYKWPRLEEALSYYQIDDDEISGTFHRAGFDAYCTALVVVEMIRDGVYGET